MQQLVPRHSEQVVVHLHAKIPYDVVADLLRDTELGVQQPAVQKRQAHQAAQLAHGAVVAGNLSGAHGVDGQRVDHHGREKQEGQQRGDLGQAQTHDLGYVPTAQPERLHRAGHRCSGMLVPASSWERTKASSKKLSASYPSSVSGTSRPGTVMGQASSAGA